jgi:ATP-dependent exoDNAse (exonuclease V) beta subunit
MDHKPFHIYRSSAGSGKTRVLAREYIQLALKKPDYFKYILAMTFTNKSTQEMKERILKYLYDFTKGQSQDLANEIIANLDAEGVKIKPEQILEKSEQVLKLLLHRYSEFSVSTIDAFFQRIIRAFTRETGLLGNFRLEVENDLVIEEAVELLMQALATDAELRGWVLDYSIDKLEQGNKWDIRSSLIAFASSLLKQESFKAIEDDVYTVTQNKTFFHQFKRELSKTQYAIERYVFEGAKKLYLELEEQQLKDDDFANKSRGVSAFIRSLTNEIKKPTKAVLEVIDKPEKWAHKNSPARQQISSLAQKRWQPQLAALLDFIETNWKHYHSAKEVTKNLHSFGLLADLVSQQKKYLANENLMLLSDASKFLNKLVNNQDASFLYEKVGSFYKHYLIDEFQDTSGLQWKNLLPLLQNGIAQNYKSLIVGDIKQSIYRWRGGDLSILQKQIKHDVSPLLSQTHALNTNYRSEENIVCFNNALFRTAAHIISTQTGSDFPLQAYEDSVQKSYRNNGQGYVRIEFLPTDKEQTFQQVSLEKLPLLVEELQAAGVKMRDIAFLVRDNKDGQVIASRFIQYRTEQGKPSFNYEVVSNESLMLYRAASVAVVVNALRVLHNPMNSIAKAHIAYEYQRLWPAQTFTDWNDVFMSVKTKKYEQFVPPGFTQKQTYLASLSLYEMVEGLIQVFNLGHIAEEIIYIQSFQDCVQEFTQRERSDLGAFLDWWEINKEKKSVQVPSGVDAAQIITIHKSKGLQFKYVIVPFLNWDLGHGTKGPVLWVQSTDHLFKNAGHIPVKYSSELENTFFAEYYQEETKRINLDNLNLLYVAFTRAEVGLVAFGPDNNKPEAKHAGNLVWNSICGNEELRPLLNEPARIFTLGNLAAAPTPLGTDKTVALKNYTVTPWRDRLALRKTGSDYFQASDKRKKINQGILLHSVLSKVKYPQEWPHVLQAQLAAGFVSPDELVQWKDTFDWLIQEPSLRFCFSKEATHKTEVSIFTKEGDEKRIDRISMVEKKVCVLDYKTGEETAHDEQQVRAYCELLKEMGFTTVNGVVVYLNEKRVVQL